MRLELRNLFRQQGGLCRNFLIQCIKLSTKLSLETWIWVTFTNLDLSSTMTHLILRTKGTLNLSLTSIPRWGINGTHWFEKWRMYKKFHRALWKIFVIKMLKGIIFFLDTKWSHWTIISSKMQDTRLMGSQWKMQD